MALPAGQRIGAYEIVSQLGAGGMGEVYRARDSKLKREVAIKVLPADVAGDRERLARFQREAEVLASLNHPHIAQVFGIENPPEGGHHSAALVMELVEGDDLSQRIARGPIPIDEALPIAKQIAEALEAAHDAGIIHRDLKPANVKVKDDGTVKVLDFGLAKAVDEPKGSSLHEIVNSPTITSPAMTMRGVILGTAAYMSPEQAKGKAVDKRADIWAFGCVLFEMLSGKRAFKGDDVTDIITSVMRDAPDWNALPTQTPIAIRTLLRRCLEKNPRQRVPHMAIARLEIDDTIASGRETKPASAPARGGAARLLPLAAAAAAIAGIALGWSLSRATDGTIAGRAAVEPTAIVADIPAPPGVVAAFYDGFALSPDAATLAFAARDASGRRQLWLRRIDGAIAQPLPGTEGAQYPFWSPDGKEVAYFTNGKLMRIAAGGGTPQVLGDAPNPITLGSWSSRGDVLLDSGLGYSGGLRLLTPQGGTPQTLGIEGHKPSWMPDGRGFLFLRRDPKDDQLMAASAIEAKEPDRVGDGGLDRGYFFEAGGFVFRNRKGTLTVQRFDAAARTLLGEPVVLAGLTGTPRSWFALSAAGDTVVTLAQRSPAEIGDAGDPVARLRWVDRAGATLENIGGAERYWMNELAPDGRRLLTHSGPSTWVIGSRTRNRLRGPDDLTGMVWSPDGATVAYARRGVVYKQAVDQDTPPVEVGHLPDGSQVSDWSHDGKSLLWAINGDVVRVDVATGQQTAMRAGSAHEMQARFSPDGRWIAYQSNATDREEVFIASVAGGTATQVSTAGGQHPRWRGDGKEIYYVDPDGAVVAAPVTLGTSPAVGTPIVLFRVPLNDITLGLVAPYDVASDGQRFLVNVLDTPSSLLYIRGFQRLLK